jgi:phosphoribosylamine--glycine ligase
VLGVTALGSTLAEARSRAYRAVAAISWPGAHARTDIAADAAATATAEATTASAADPTGMAHPAGPDVLVATNAPGVVR